MKKSANDALRRPWRVLAMAAMALCSLTMMGALRPAAAVPIKINYNDAQGEGFFDPKLGELRRTAFEAAAAVWSRTLEGNVPVEIDAEFNPLAISEEGALLGQAGPNSVVSDFQGARPDTFYVTALASQLAGTDVAPGEADIGAEFNSEFDSGIFQGQRFYYGLDSNPPGDDVDFFTVCLHEFCHGLGFLSLAKQDGNYFTPNPSIYERFLFLGTGDNAKPIIDLSRSERAASLVSDNLFFDGPKTRSGNGDQPAKIFAPNPYQGGSSVSHPDEDTYSGINELMTPFSSGVAHEPGPLVTGIMRDLGWAFTGIDIPQPTPGPSPTAGPTPTATPLPRPTAGPTPLPPPLNDNFSNATLIRGANGFIAGRNINATKEQGEPNHVNTGGTSVWFRWTAPSRGNVTFSTAGSSFDTLLGIYTGASVDRLTRIAADDDVRTGVITSSATFTTVANQTYFIAVDGFFGASGRTVLSWQFTPSPPVPPRNDNFERAQPITGAEGGIAGDSTDASRQVGEPVHAGRGGRSIWYNWLAPADGRVTFTTAGSNFDTLLAVYTGDVLTRLTPVASNSNASMSDLSSRVTFAVKARQRYKIAIDGLRGIGGIGFLNWSMSTTPPLNDRFLNAQLLSGNSGRVMGNNFNATKEISEPNHAGNRGGRSLWYRWTAPASGRAGFTTTRGLLVTSLAVYIGTRINALQPVEGSPLDGLQPTNTVIFGAEAGETYMIAVDGFFNANSASTSVGPFLLEWLLIPDVQTPPSQPNQPAAATNRSPLALSSATADSTTSWVKLRFTGPVDEAIAADATHYTVEINGVAAEIEGVSANASGEVMLAIANGLKSGERLTVSWRDLRDTAGRTLEGRSAPFVVR